MKLEEIQKKLEQLPKEWDNYFNVRMVAQSIPNFLENELQIVLPVRLRLSAESEFKLFKKNTRFIVKAVEYAKRQQIDIANEIAFLELQINSGKTAAEYFYKPLYASQNQEWHRRGKELVQAFRDVGHGFDIWADWFQGRINGVPTDKKFLEAVAYLPEEILDQEPKYINAYLKSLGNAAGALNRVRVIFLGYGEAGKTSLIRALNGLEVDEGKEKMTPGIDISTWEVPDTEITAHFWDFGGQVVAHATHQFFLRSRCLYVLLLDGRTEINANEQAEYWLEHVRAFGNKAPVILVGNKADLCAVNLDMRQLKEKHPNVIDFYPLSCTQYQNQYALEFQRFQKDLSKEVAELGVHTVRFGKAHLAVLDELTERSGTESFLPKTDWLDLCADKGLAEQGDLNQAWLLDLFDKLGVIVHFPKLAALDSYILNPRWLTYGVYTLLYSNEAKEKKGRLQESEIIRILSEAEVRDHLGNILSYPQEKAWIVLKAMEEFDLSFPCRHEPDSIVIPALLDSDQPKHGFDKQDSLAFEFD
ncbi:MAG: hypothetical protein D3904_10365, partial [Candidatus Electrothrix sp. EH2]|nr:hypothetical protein [Candidatus Electrothrix sp. EH2]